MVSFASGRSSILLSETIGFGFQVRFSAKKLRNLEKKVSAVDVKTSPMDLSSCPICNVAFPVSQLERYYRFLFSFSFSSDFPLLLSIILLEFRSIDSVMNCIKKTKTENFFLLDWLARFLGKVSVEMLNADFGCLVLHVDMQTVTLRRMNKLWMT